MTEEFKRKLTAILSADVAGYSRLMDDDEEATIRTLKEYRFFIAETVEKYRGHVVDSPGDNILAEFASVVDAVKCAMEIQQGLHKKNAEFSDDRKMQFRIGINLGDVIEEGDRIYGDGVNIAARVESLADAGGICISGTAYDQVVNKLDLKYEDLGGYQVKNIRRPVRVYRVPVEYEPEKEKSVLDSIIDFSVPTDKPSIAILPFVNMSGDPEQEYFSDGMTEEIIFALSKVPDIFVIASTSTFTYKGRKVKVQEIGKELGVKYVLEGSVRRVGNRIRVTAQLIDAMIGNHLWAEGYDRDLEEIFKLQDEITVRILEQLSIKLYFDLKSEWVSSKGTNNLEAYLKFWQGVEYLNRQNKNDYVMACQLFREVIALDPAWGLGYGIFALAILQYFSIGWSNSAEESIQDAMEYANKAISLDATLPHAYAALSTLYLYQKLYDRAVAEAEKAIAVQPNFFLGYIALGQALRVSGKPLKALEIIKNAIRLSPKYMIIRQELAMAYFDSGQYLESITLIKEGLKQIPDFLNLHVRLAAAYILAGREDDARNQAKELQRIDPQFSVDRYVPIYPYKNQSDTDRILNALRKAGLK